MFMIWYHYVGMLKHNLFNKWSLRKKAPLYRSQCSISPSGATIVLSILIFVHEPRFPVMDAENW